ncbi:MAG: hypothetical protein SXQ77_09320, partial [Halobacteria archaeon]|nr:hypothetical protein [Halobacteria archaeon]
MKRADRVFWRNELLPRTMPSQRTGRSTNPISSPATTVPIAVVFSIITGLRCSGNELSCGGINIGYAIYEDCPTGIRGGAGRLTGKGKREEEN